MGAEPLKNGQWEDFCLAYVYETHYNGSKAARKAGFAPSSAPQHASWLIRNHQEIRDRIKFLRDQKLAATVHDAQYIAERLRELASFDLRDLYDEEGNFLPMSGWPEHAGRCVTEVQHDPETGDIKKVKAETRASFLRDLGRHVDVQAFLDRAEQTNTIAFEDLDFSGRDNES